MLTLQDALSYDDTQPAPVNQTTIFFGFPQYEAVDASDGKLLVLTPISRGHVAIQQVITKPHYHASIPASNIWGPDYGSVLSRYFRSLTQNGNKLALQDLTIPFSVSYGGSTEFASLEAVYFIQASLLPESNAHTGSDSVTEKVAATASSTKETLRSKEEVASISVPLLGLESKLSASMTATSSSSRLNSVVDNSIFCVNKSVYIKYLEQLFPSIPEENESVLLYLLSDLVDVTGPVPKLATASDNGSLQAFTRTLKDFGLPANDAAFITITKDFNQFFDFPLKMPKIQLLSLAGNIQVNSTSTVTKPQFDFYHLSASFSVQVGRPDDEPIQQISRYAWSAAVEPTMNSLHFSFQDKYTTNTILGPVSVSVTDYENTEIFSTDFAATDPLLQNLNIVVDLRTPPVLKGPSAGTVQTSKKLRGKVVSMAKNCTLKGSVIVQAQSNADGPWNTVSTTISDKSGNFVMPYPHGSFIAARAITSLDPSSITPIPVDPKFKHETISSEFLYILLSKSSDDNTKKDDCGCNPTTTAGRLPSQTDLIQSDQYTQDVGDCMNLSVPNRTLKEFNYTALVRNSDPDVANYTLTSSEKKDPKTAMTTTVYNLTSNGKVTRRRIDLNNPIKWEDDSANGKDESLYEAVTVSTGHILRYKSEFRADGYSLGDLLHSLPLAPGQKKEIAILDSSHTFRGSESQALSASEKLANDLTSGRDIADQIGGSIGEQLAGSSESETGGVSAQVGASGGGLGWGANIGVAGGYAKSASSANQSSGRDLDGHFSELLRQGIHQNASSYRQQNSSIVTTAQEGQQFHAETTVVANHNHCHSITIMHYEVLRHFAVFQELVGVEEALFIPFPLTKFNFENTSKWADVLVKRLLPLSANTYMSTAGFASSNARHPLTRAFDAVSRVKSNWELLNWPDGAYDTEPIIWAKGSFSMSVNISRPNTRYDMIRSMPILDALFDDDGVRSLLLGVLTGGLSFWTGGVGVPGSETESRRDITNKFMRIDPIWRKRKPADCIRVINFDPVSADHSQGFDPVEFFSDSVRELEMWKIYSYLLGNGRTSEGVRKTLKHYFLDATISEWDGIWNDKMAPDIYARIFQSIAFKNIGFDLTQVDTYHGGRRLLHIGFSGSIGLTRRDPNVQFLTITCKDSVAKELRKYDAEFIVTSLKATYSTDHYNGLLYNGGVNNDLLDDATIFCPETAAEKQSPKDDDRWMAQRLITHLNRNIEYYNRVLLYSLDAQRRYMLLDGFHIETFDQDGHSVGHHSLASIVKNSPVGMAGNSMCFPVSPGYKVDRSIILDAGDGEETTAASLLDLYRPETPPAPYRLSIPSRGIYAESMIGKCDSCESLKPDSSQDWTKFTTDEPTAINPIQPPQTTVTNYQPTTKDFATPMISIQNAPAAPDPGAGLGAVTSLLGKSGIFQDVTGLEGTQKAALQTLLSNNEGARAAAGAASTAATQSHNTANTSQIMGTIQQAQDSGILTKTEAGQLVKQHIQSQIDGGQMAKTEMAQNTKPPLAEATVAAMANNKALEATIYDGKVVSSVKVAATATPTKTKVKITPDVPIVVQEIGTQTCWAAAATMMASWKAGKLLTPEEALRKAGEPFVTMFKNKAALPQGQKDAFVLAMGMASEGPASYPPTQYVTWMKMYGPLWVTTDANFSEMFSPHASILVKIDGDDHDDGVNWTFTWINPSNGNTQTQSFKDFMVAYNQMVTDNQGDLFPQIVHFSTKISDKGSGSSGIPNRPGEGFGVRGPLDQKWPVHENLTLSALITSDYGLDPRTTYANALPSTLEILRGVVWNDDPANDFFVESRDNNWIFSTGAAWFAKFLMGEHLNYDEKNIIGRSHFWDLQFLHGMASDIGEDPRDTLAKIMLWMEVMYKLSIGQDMIFQGTPINSEKVSKITSQYNIKRYHLEDFFTDTSIPTKTESLRQLLARNTIYAGVKIPHRAFGSCMHLIQDSYAKGHTRRTLLNTSDLKPGSMTEFIDGKWAKLGAVENFHTYFKQEDHGEWDQWHWFGWGAMDPANPDSFNPLYGARQGRDKAAEFANFWAAKAPWETGVKKWLMEEVFALSPNVTIAENSV